MATIARRGAGALPVALARLQRVPLPGMVDQSFSEQAREAILEAIIKAAPKVGNSPAGVRDLAEAFALLERGLIPNAGVVRSRT